MTHGVGLVVGIGNFEELQYLLQLLDTFAHPHCAKIRLIIMLDSPAQSVVSKEEALVPFPIRATMSWYFSEQHIDRRLDAGQSLARFLFSNRCGEGELIGEITVYTDVKPFP